MHVTRCLVRDGTLRLFDLSRRVLIYSLVDGLKDGVYSIAIDDCPRANPRLLASYNRVFGASDNPGGVQPSATTDEANCGSFSADGSKILLGVQAVDDAGGSWIGTTDGKAWHHVSPWVSCRWLDATTIVANATLNPLIDPIAIDISSGRPEFVADPDALNGIASHDGRLIFYQRALSPDPSLGLIADHNAGSTQTVSLEQPLQTPDPGQPLWSSVWNEDDARFVLMEPGTVSPHVAIYARGALSPVKEPISVQFNAAGWFAPNVIWFSTFGYLRFIDLTTEQRTAVALPDDVGLVMIADQRQGDVEAIAVTSDAAPLDSIKQMGIAFRRPPSWRVGTCHTLCAVDGYDFRWLLSSRFYPANTPLTFAMTSDSVSTTLNNITRSEKRLCSGALCAYSEDRSSVRLGGVMFTKLVVAGLNGNATYYVGSFGHGTIIVRTTLEDPSEQVVVDSLRAL